MRSLSWDRADLIRRVRKDLWRFLTPAASVETNLLEAAALLQMRPFEVRTVGALQFLVSQELGHLLDYMPLLLRRLATTTTHEEEITADRIRGSIQWGRTIGLRYASGAPNVYVTAPSRRAFQTPENELLVILLDAAVKLGTETGWRHSEAQDVGSLISDRVSRATQWLQSRMLLEVERRPVSPRSISRVRSGRFKRRYEPVINAYDRFSELVKQLDRQGIRRAIETHGLATRDDPTVFEIYCTFQVLRALRSSGWRLTRFGLFRGALSLRGRRNGEQIRVIYQSPPRALSRGSRYGAIQYRHEITPGALRPDLSIWHMSNEQTRWLVVEVKGGKRPVVESARAATRDLLAYRSAFSRVLDLQVEPYGLGIVWGAELDPSPESEILLCTPDTLGAALGLCGL